MHLLDQVARANERIVVSAPHSAAPLCLPGTDVLATAVASCPLRYVLHDDVTELCTELAFEDDTMLGSSVELLRVPAPALWVEFVGGARHKVFSDLGRLGAANESRQRIGLLSTSDERGRRGRIDVCWESLAGLTPDVAPFAIEYDFDDASYSDVGRCADRGPSIGVTVAGHPPLDGLFKHVRYTLRPEWHQYYAQFAADDRHYRGLVRQAVDPLLEDVPFFAMFCLLVLSKSALREQHSDRRRLNEARATRGRAPLLDHVEVTMNLASGATREAPAGHRSSPRLHFVRGHLVRRGNAIHWRTSHMRGKPEIGSIRSRTISLRMSSRV